MDSARRTVMGRRPPGGEPSLRDAARASAREAALRSPPARWVAVERRAAQRNIPLVATSLALTYAILTPLPVLRAGLAAGGWLMLITGASAASMLALRSIARRHLIRRRWAHTVLGLALSTLVVRCLAGWWFFATGQETGLLAIAVLMIGALCIAGAWTFALVGAAIAGWLAIIWAADLPWPPVYTTIFLVGAAPVAALIRSVRMDALRRDDDFRVREARRSAQLADALRRETESERRFHDIFDRIHDVYFRVALNGELQMLSPSVRQWGYRPEDLVGGDAHRLFAEGHFEAGRALLLDDGEVADREFRVRTASGEPTPVSVTARLIRDGLGRPVAFEGILRDISERKRLDEERQRQQAELAHVLRLGSMGEMAAQLAHELTQPLAAIANYAGACARHIRSGTGSADKVLEGLDLMSAQALRAGNIVHRIRAYVAKRPPRREDTDLRKLVHAAVETVAPEARRRSVAIEVHEPEEAIAVRVDRIQIEQVIVNLLMNALEAIVTAAADERVSVAVDRTCDGVPQVSVRDPGRGLSADTERIFEPFFSTKPDGLGMGLAISKSIVKGHGGELLASTNTESGTTFRFTIPPPEHATRMRGRE